MAVKLGQGCRAVKRDETAIAVVGKAYHRALVREWKERTVAEGIGPLGWQNWRAYSGGQSVTAGEVACYTDAQIAGEALDGLGPYQLLNAPPAPLRPGEAQLAVVLRISYHAPPPRGIQPLGPNNLGGYHSGDLPDEVASLVSLALDCRLKAAGTIRDFYPGASPHGEPGDHRQPYLAPPAGPKLPGMTDTVQLDTCVPLLERYPQLSATQADTLLRAARAYQQALWVAEDDPALAWLKLVSAVETAANLWARGRRKDPPEAVLRKLEPDLAAILEKAGGEPHLVEVARRIAQQMRARKKFVDFLLAFPATPPMPRPVIGPLDWSPAAMAVHLNIICKWRSKDLHDGIPFPLPMGRAAVRVNQQGGFSEVPYGHGHARWTGPRPWAYEDIPMLLNTFKYIVGHALRAWWQTIP